MVIAFQVSLFFGQVTVVVHKKLWRFRLSVLSGSLNLFCLHLVWVTDLSFEDAQIRKISDVAEL